MKPNLPRGTRDFGPETLQKRNYIFDVIRKNYEQFGFRAIETPSMETLQTLTGKYGDEGDQLLFKILNSGDFLKKADGGEDAKALLPKISEKGLRYDLTIPFARFVVMNQNDLAFPFKRFQIQPVWRADRPQKGRYREFYQCDADVIGSSSLQYEAEFIQILDSVFTQLNLEVNIRINNRKILQGMATQIGHPEKLIPITVAIDKLDKVPREKVIDDLHHKASIPIADCERLFGLMDLGVNKGIEEALDALQEAFSSHGENQIGLDGCDDLRAVLQLLESVQVKSQLSFDPTLARGLNYYTGCIFEVNSLEAKIGSIAAGGRYDDLTGLFGLPNMSGVGISFGADRIYDVLEELQKFPDEVFTGLDLLIVTFDEDCHRHGFKLLQQFREQGVKVELYPEPAKMKKQMKYANARSASHVLVIGSDEMESGMYTLKNMADGSQQKQSLGDCLNQFK